MEKKVIVLTPNGRRQNVKVNPNTTLLQILEDACQKHGLDSDDYCLKHHNKEVDLTQMFRFSGLPNNALLEMLQTEKKRIATNVDICVQLEDGSRAQGQFKPSENLWTVVEELNAEAAAAYISPVAIYMRQEIVGKKEMANTSLKSLGITEGRAMIRFINKNPEELKTQANVYVAATVKVSPKADDVTPKNTRSTAAGAGGFAITRDLVQSLKKVETPAEETAKQNVEDENMDTTNTVKAEKEKPKYDWDSGTGRTIRHSEVDLAEQAANERADKERLAADMEVEPLVNIIGDRNAILYSLDSSQKHMDDLPDSFFDLTVNDLKLVLRDLKKVMSGNEDTPLLTEKLRELEENKTMLNKIAQYKNCVIRIQFPDRFVLQGLFKPIDKLSDVVKFVRTFLQNSETNFHLFTIPPKIVLPLDMTLLELDLVPTAVVHFALQEDSSSATMDTETLQNAEQTFLKAEFLDKLTTAEGALYAANKFRISNRKASIQVQAGSNIEAAVPTQPDSTVVPTTSRATGAIPKRPRNEDAFKQTS